MPAQPTLGSAAYLKAAGRVLAVLLLLFVFLLGINGLGTGFKLFGKDLLGAFFAATESPFVGLVVGILATTLVQSSSVTTSMIVALVAAPENPLPMANAVPMIMGANIGTTVTATVVSLAHMARRQEFRRAFAVATCHDFFNVMTVAALLPLEIATGFLSRSANFVASLLGGLSGVKYESPLKSALSTAITPVKSLAEVLFDGKVGQAVVVIILSAGLIFISLTLIVRVLRSALKTRVEAYVTRALQAPALVSMIVGMVVTVMVQSSSITTSLLVPLAGAGLITLRSAFPITLGANVGTTITALLAALAVSGPHAGAGVRIALVHLLFNLVGILLIYPIQRIRQWPLRGARWLAAMAAESRKLAIVLVLGFFYGVPALLIFIHRLITS